MARATLPNILFSTLACGAKVGVEAWVASRGEGSEGWEPMATRSTVIAVFCTSDGTVLERETRPDFAGALPRLFCGGGWRWGALLGCGRLAAAALLAKDVPGRCFLAIAFSGAGFLATATLEVGLRIGAGLLTAGLPTIFLGAFPMAFFAMLLEATPLLAACLAGTLATGFFDAALGIFFPMDLAPDLVADLALDRGADLAAAFLAVELARETGRLATGFFAAAFLAGFFMVFLMSFPGVG